MPNKLTIDVVITNYNAWRQVEKCVMAFREFGSNEIGQIIVVDDASEPYDIPSDWKSKIVLITNSKNRGYVTSVNIGVKQSEADLILVFDADARPLKPFATRLRELFSAPDKLGILGFRTLNREGGSTGNSCAMPSASDLFLGQGLASRWDKWKGGGDGKSYVFSCAMAMRREAYLAVNGFDEDFDFLDADVDFSIRVTKAGYAVREDNELAAFHEGGGSPQKSSRRLLRHYRNRFLLLKKHNRLPNKFILRNGVLVRLFLEWVFLKTLGRTRFTPEQLEDKIAGRKQLLSYVASEWR